MSLLRKYNKNILFLLCIPMYSYIIKPSDVNNGGGGSGGSGGSGGGGGGCGN